MPSLSGKNNPNYSHGMCGTRIYNCWKNMNSRCNTKTRPDYKYYGGRGIKICKRWSRFKNFYIDMGASYKADLTLDRVNPNLGYSKSNCRWATHETQMSNTTRNKYITYKNKKLTLSEFARLSTSDRRTVENRLKRGIIPEVALIDLNGGHMTKNLLKGKRQLKTNQ